MLFALASSPNASDPYQVSMQYQKMKCKIIILLRIFFYDRNVGRCSVDAYQVHTVLYYSSASLLVHTSQYHVVQNYVYHSVNDIIVPGTSRSMVVQCGAAII